jgi:hypothetical protein
VSGARNGADGPKSQLKGDRSADRPQGPGERVYRGAVRGFSLVFVAVGLLLLTVTLANGGDPLSVGFLIGIAFVGVGAGRLWVGERMGR